MGFRLTSLLKTEWTVMLKRGCDKGEICIEDNGLWGLRLFPATREDCDAVWPALFVTDRFLPSMFGKERVILTLCPVLLEEFISDLKALKARFFVTREEVAEWLSRIKGKKVEVTEKIGLVKPLETVYVIEEVKDFGVWAVNVESGVVDSG